MRWNIHNPQARSAFSATSQVSCLECERAPRPCVTNARAPTWLESENGCWSQEPFSASREPIACKDRRDRLYITNVRHDKRQILRTRSWRMPVTYALSFALDIQPSVYSESLLFRLGLYCKAAILFSAGESFEANFRFLKPLFGCEPHPPSAAW